MRDQSTLEKPSWLHKDQNHARNHSGSTLRLQGGHPSFAHMHGCRGLSTYSTPCAQYSHATQIDVTVPTQQGNTAYTVTLCVAVGTCAPIQAGVVIMLLGFEWWVNGALVLAKTHQPTSPGMTVGFAGKPAQAAQM